MKFSKLLPLCGLTTLLALPFARIEKQYQQAKADPIVVDIATIISPTPTKYRFANLNTFSAYFSFSEQFIPTTNAYMNDHLTDWKDANNQSIDFGEAIIINDQTFRYWVNYTNADLNYPRMNGLCEFPMTAGDTFRPVVIYLDESSGFKMEFRFDLNYFPSDSITITFKAGLFKGYYNSKSYELSEDLTYYATLDTANKDLDAENDSRVEFVSQRTNEVDYKGEIKAINGISEKTADGGYKYYRYTVWTTIKRDIEYAHNLYPARFYRYMYDNILMNGKTLTHYNVWARGNSKDFTDLGNKTQNPAYETIHPDSSMSILRTVQDLAVILQMVVDQDNYVFFVHVPNQLMTDLSLGAPGSCTFAIRSNSAWRTVDADGAQVVARINPQTVNNAASDAAEELENYVPDLSIYRQNEQNQITSIIYNAENNIVKANTIKAIEMILATAEEQIDAIKTDAQMTESEHVDAVIALIDAIPDTMTDQEEYLALVSAAKEAYASLTDAEKDLLDDEYLNKLLAAEALIAETSLNNYKALVKAQIAALFDVNNYSGENKTLLQSLINQVYEDIDNATNKDEIDDYYEAFVLEANIIPTDEELYGQQLVAKKTEAIAELDAIDLTVYRESQKQEVQGWISDAKVAINLSTSLEEVDDILTKTKAIISTILTDAQMTAKEELEAAKAEAIKKINDKYDEIIASGEYSEEEIAELLIIRDKAIEKINNATSAGEFDTIANDAINQLVAAKNNMDKGGSNKNQAILIGVLVGVSILTVGVGLTLFLTLRKKKAK